MEENCIIKSERKKRLHFSIKLVILLIVTLLLCHLFVFMWYTDLYDRIGHNNSFSYECDGGYWHDDGYITVENGQCMRHKQVAKIIDEEIYWDSDWHEKFEHTWVARPCKSVIHNYSNKYDFAFQALKNGYAETDQSYFETRDNFNIAYSIAFPFYIIFALIIILFHLKNRKYEILVAETGVEGKGSFGKKINIPAYNIKSATKKGKYKVIIDTLDGAKKFKFIKNSDEIIEAINNLYKTAPNTFQATMPQGAEQISTSKELETYKDLFESGIISKEEFEQKCNELTN